MIDVGYPIEGERRKPEFTAGFPVVMADGQTWTFPRITLGSMEPRREPEGGFRAAALYHANGRPLPDYEHWSDVVMGIEGVDSRTYWDIRMGAAAELLGLNYRLTDAELAHLLRFEPDEARPPDRPEDGPYTERWRLIDKGILGVLPKPSPGTDASPVPSSDCPGT